MGMNFNSKVQVITEERYRELIMAEEDLKEVNHKLQDAKKYANSMGTLYDKTYAAYSDKKHEVDKLNQEIKKLRMANAELEDMVDEARNLPKSSLEEELIKVFTKAFERNGVDF